MSNEQVRNILRDIYSSIKSSEAAAEGDKSTNWQIDDKSDDIEGEY